MFEAIKLLMMNYKVKISDINKILEFVDKDNDGAVSANEVIKAIKSFMFRG